MNGLGLSEVVHSESNRLLLRLRTLLRFQRPGYGEIGESTPELSALERDLESRFAFAYYRPRLSPFNYQFNLFTLWLLDTIFQDLLPLPEARELLEPGCQDFARLPALRSFLAKTNGSVNRITGLELDPFPLLHDFRSRWDRAHYYLSLNPTRDRYLACDFFTWSEPAHLVFCFYPFVSPHPALAWGLPASYGHALPWVQAFERNILPGGLLLVVHQGSWEEEEFDRSREGSGLTLQRRQHLNCPFFALPHPACVSAYRCAALSRGPN